MWIPKAAPRGSMAMTSQTHEVWDLPYSNTFDTWQPFKFNYDVYSAIREMIPFCDVAIIKYLKLIGTFFIDTFGNKRAQTMIDDFIKSVPVNYFDIGYYDWQRQMVDSALEFGAGYGELILTKSLKDIARMKVARAKDFRFLKQNDKLVLGQMDKYGFKPIPFDNNDLLFMLAFDKRQGHPQPYSLFESLPFVTNIFQRIMKTVDNQLWRVGDPTVIAWIEPGPNANMVETTNCLSGLKSQMATALQNRRRGQVSDIYGAAPIGGKLHFEFLGGEQHIMDITVPIRTVLEQIVAKTGFPPFMLGLSWSTTERLSTHQNDMIVSTVDGYREQINPILEQIIGMKFTLAGYPGLKFEIKWNAVNLMDEVEQAKAKNMNAMAKDKEVDALIKMVDYGWISSEDAIDNLVENGIVNKKVLKRIGNEGVVGRLREQMKFRMAQKLGLNGNGKVNGGSVRVLG